MDAITQTGAGPVTVTQRPAQAVEGQFSIVSDFLNREGEWREVYVEVSGYFGSHGPHVFAAAPELREALQELRNECGGRPRPDRLIELLAKADAALAKAEGRTNA